jgi:hypothetical protein
MRLRHLPLPLLAALASLAACAAQPPGEPLPTLTQANAGAADPTRQAVLSASTAFSDPAALAGRPADAARAAAQLEYLAAVLPTDQRWIEATPTLFGQLAQARSELRGALGIAPTAPPVATVRSLSEAADGLDARNRVAAAAALAPIAPGGGNAMLARLERLPPLPLAASATRLAENEMLDIARRDPG